AHARFGLEIDAAGDRAGAHGELAGGHSNRRRLEPESPAQDGLEGSFSTAVAGQAEGVEAQLPDAVEGDSLETQRPREAPAAAGPRRRSHAGAAQHLRPHALAMELRDAERPAEERRQVDPSVRTLRGHRPGHVARVADDLEPPDVHAPRQEAPGRAPGDAEPLRVTAEGAVAEGNVEKEVDRQQVEPRQQEEAGEDALQPAPHGLLFGLDHGLTYLSRIGASASPMPRAS